MDAASRLIQKAFEQDLEHSRVVLKHMFEHRQLLMMQLDRKIGQRDAIITLIQHMERVLRLRLHDKCDEHAQLVKSIEALEKQG